MSNQNVQNLDFSDISSQTNNYETSFHESLGSSTFRTTTSTTATRKIDNLEKNLEKNKLRKKPRAFGIRGRDQGQQNFYNNQNPTNREFLEDSDTFKEEDSSSTISGVVAEFQKKFPDIDFGVHIKTYFRQLLISTLYGFIYDISNREIFEIIDAGEEQEFFYTEQALAPKTKEFREYANILLTSNASLILEEVGYQIKELYHFKDWDDSNLNSRQKEEIIAFDIKPPKIKFEEGLTEDTCYEMEISAKLQSMQKRLSRMVQKKSEMEQTFKDIQNGTSDYLIDILEYILILLPKTNIQMSEITTSWSKTYPLIQAVLLIFNFEINYIISQADADYNNSKTVKNFDKNLNSDLTNPKFKMIFSSPEDEDNVRSIKKIIQKYLKYTSKRCDQGEVSFVYATCLSFLKEIAR